MLSLPQVLHEAQQHSVSEIAIEPGEPVTFHGDQGVLVLGDGLVEGDISEALTQVLAPDQQAELLVAGMVSFHVEGYAEWSLVAETSPEGVVIRGRVRDGVIPDAVGVPLELPPLSQHFVDEPTSEIRPSAAALSALRQSGTRSTRWDVAVAGSVLEEVEDLGSGAIEDPTLRPGRLAETTQVPRPPVDEPPEDMPIDFALVGQGTPTADLPAVEHAGKQTARDLVVPGREDVGRNATVPQMVAVSTEAPPSVDVEALARHADAIGPGTVVYLAEVGVGESLLVAWGRDGEILDAEQVEVRTGRPLTAMPRVVDVLVRLEDPSRCLGWLLRRLEEGARVIVETRARTADGAQRILLGQGATPQAVQWLRAHGQVWLYEQGGQWVLEPV